MKFTARYAAFQAIVIEEQRQYFQDGRDRLIRPAVVADFAEEATDEMYRGQEGESDYRAMRGGGFLDTEVAQKRHGWTDDERKAVDERLLEIARTDGDVKEYVIPKPTPPWPTYDTTHHAQIAKFAAELGFVNEALLYEQRTKNRTSVVAELQEIVSQQAAEESLTAA